MALEANRVSYSVGDTRILQDCDLSVEPGRLTVVVGPNGAGKSTLLRVLAGEILPDAGEVTLDGEGLATMSGGELALRRAVLPQSSMLQAAFRARSVVELGRTPHPGRSSHGADAAAIDSAMLRTGTAAFAQRLYPSLSGGEQQRVHLARALAQITGLDGSYLLLDEPTSSLDLQHQHRVLAIARGLAREGRGILAVVHDLNLASQYADVVCMMHNGTTTLTGPPAVVFTSETIRAVFGTEVLITKHPCDSCPLIVAVGLAGERSWNDSNTGSARGA